MTQRKQTGTSTETLHGISLNSGDWITNVHFTAPAVTGGVLAFQPKEKQTRIDGEYFAEACCLKLPDGEKKLDHINRWIQAN